MGPDKAGNFHGGTGFTYGADHRPTGLVRKVGRLADAELLEEGRRSSHVGAHSDVPQLPSFFVRGRLARHQSNQRAEAFEFDRALVAIDLDIRTPVGVDGSNCRIEPLHEKQAVSQVAYRAAVAQETHLERLAWAWGNRDSPLPYRHAIVGPGGVRPQRQDLAGLEDMFGDGEWQFHHGHAPKAQLSDRPGRKLENARAFVQELMADAQSSRFRVEADFEGLADARGRFHCTHET